MIDAGSTQLDSQPNTGAGAQLVAMDAYAKSNRDSGLEDLARFVSVKGMG